MKFSIGDKILIKRTGEEGIVCGYIGNDMLEVEVSGTIFPVYTDEVEHPYLTWFTQKKKQQTSSISRPEQFPIEPPKTIEKRQSSGISLSFMPVFFHDAMEDLVSELKIFLVNETPYSIHFSYDVKSKTSTLFSHQGKLHPFGHLFLHSLPYESMNDLPKFNWQLSNADTLSDKIESGTLRIRPPKLFEQINQLLVKNEATFSYLLLSEFSPIEKKQAVQIPVQKIAPEFKKSKESKKISLADLPRYEIDLHIEKLLPSHKGMNNATIMQLQLSTFQRSLDLAISYHQHKMIVIHGVGSGALREAIHNILRQTSEVEAFRNEYMGRYGFGATEIIFKK
ncbi:MAG: Smr/MutS family protein [Bacteroidetes bacterium]|nr:Smr/MutS family protein [Bacteroidota bacterium]